MDCAGRLVSPQSSSDQTIGAMRGQGIRTSDCLGKLRRVADELESAVRHLRRPQEAPPDRDFVVHEAHDAQDQPTDSREVFGPAARPVPKLVLSHLEVENPMPPVLDRPTVPDGRQDVLWRIRHLCRVRADFKSSFLAGIWWENRVVCQKADP